MTVLTSAPNPSVAGQPVTFSVEVSPAVTGGAPIGWRRLVVAASAEDGSVTISDGDTVLAVIELQRGRASFTTSSLSPGPHTITAAFSGTATAAPSSDTLVQRVAPAGELAATR